MSTYYKQIPVQFIVDETWKLYSKAELQKMQFSLISAMFTLLVMQNVVVWDALKGMAKPILPKPVYF